MTHIIIIGGGISGLSAAWELQQLAGEQIRFTVLEADSRWGGKIRTQTMPSPEPERDGQFLIDAGPESFVTRKPAAWQLTRELGLAEQAINPGNEAAGTYVLDHGRVVPLPLTPRTMLTTDLLSWRGKLRLLAEPFIPPRRDGQDESLAEFVTRRLGPEMLNKVVGPVLGGIYNTDPATQSVLVAAPIMRELEAQGSLVWGTVKHGRRRRRALAQDPHPPPGRFLGFPAGAHILVEALTEQLRGDLRLNTAVDHLTLLPDGSGAAVSLDNGLELEAQAVIIATPANVAARLLQEVDTAVATQLAQIRHVDIGTISLAYPTSAVAHIAPLRGLMIPRREGRRIDAVTWTSAKMHGRAPEGYELLRVFFGGGDSTAVGLPDDELVALVRSELADLLAITAVPLDYRLARWPRSYPQADVGHLGRVAAIEQALPHPFYVTGSSYRGLAVPDCIAQARDTARQVWEAVKS